MTPAGRAARGKAVAFVAPSGTGKTTLLEKLIAELKRRGRRVGAIKHDAHRFEIDHPGKDSHRLAAAGADTTLVTSREKLALVRRHAAAPPVEEIVAAYFGDVDIVLVEGFRGSSLPRIEVRRAGRGGSLPRDAAGRDPLLVAVASDAALDLDVPVFRLDDAAGLADFLEETFIRRLPRKVQERP
ncbi:MAG: molybdopterin-guanine dinucleotide biosynthesis protein B [Gemmatimonadota bacterium]